MKKIFWVLLLFAAFGSAGAQSLSPLRGGKTSTEEDAFQLTAIAERSRQALTSRAPLVIKANETCQPNLLLCGQLIDSSLTTSDCATSQGTGDLWFFPNYSRQAIGTSVLSPDFDTIFGLFDPSGQLVRVAEAPAGSIAGFGAFLQSSGNYSLFVGAQSSSAKKTGNYTIGIACGDFECGSDVATLCLLQRRFRVQVAWHNQFNNTYGFGRAVTKTDSVGFFSFGDPNNIELLVKVLDFGDVIKVFYGELTNLEFSVAISDMEDPLQYTKTYTNTAGNCGGIDDSFLAGEESRDSSEKSAGTCKADKNTICLLNRRFALTMNWLNQFNGTSGVGGAVPMSDLTGAFFFTDKSDLELVVKMLDFGDRITVFYGALSNLQYDLIVRDTVTGAQKSYHNPPGQFCGGLDNTAFP